MAAGVLAFWGLLKGYLPGRKEMLWWMQSLANGKYANSKVPFVSRLPHPGCGDACGQARLIGQALWQSVPVACNPHQRRCVGRLKTGMCPGLARINAGLESIWDRAANRRCNPAGLMLCSMTIAIGSSDLRADRHSRPSANSTERVNHAEPGLLRKISGGVMQSSGHGGEQAVRPTDRAMSWVNVHYFGQAFFWLGKQGG